LYNELCREGYSRTVNIHHTRAPLIASAMGDFWSL
jgi:hypothetical protein